MKYDVIVIGGGSAGLMASIAASASSNKVLLIDKGDKLGRKLAISGGGRCNVTHACFDPRELARRYPRGERELIGPYHQFQAGDTILLGAARGISEKTPVKVSATQDTGRKQ